MPIKTELRPYFKFDNTEPVAQADMLGHIACNEIVKPDFLANLTKQRAQKPGGIGLAIGSGGSFSLLPFLDLEGIILVDVNPAVLGFTQFVGDCIAQAQNPDHAKEMIIHELPQDLHELELQRNSPLLPTLNHIAAEKLQREASYFGDIHWTNPHAFPGVQEAIAQTTVAYANRNITSAAFYAELSTVLRKVGEPLTYLNFSNVHHFLASTRPLQGLERLADPEATVQYSTHPLKDGGPLFATLADSFGQYLDITSGEIQTLGKKSATGRSMPRWSSRP